MLDRSQISPLRFVIPGPPVPKQRPRGRNFRTPEKTRAYEARARTAALNALSRRGEPWPRTGHFDLSLSIYFSDAVRRDTDNTEKAVSDAMNGVVWDDDVQVRATRTRAFIDRLSPLVAVVVKPDPGTYRWEPYVYDMGADKIRIMSPKSGVLWAAKWKKGRSSFARGPHWHAKCDGGGWVKSHSVSQLIEGIKEWEAEVLISN